MKFEHPFDPEQHFLVIAGANRKRIIVLNKVFFWLNQVKQSSQTIFIFVRFILFFIKGCTNTTFSPWIEKLDSSWLLQNGLVEIDWAQNFATVNHTHTAAVPPFNRDKWVRHCCCCYYWCCFCSKLTKGCIMQISILSNCFSCYQFFFDIVSYHFLFSLIIIFFYCFKTFFSCLVCCMNRTFTESLFGMTYMYYGVIGTFVTIIVAVIVSYITASDDDTCDEKLLHPMVITVKRWWYSEALSSNYDRSANINQAFEFSEGTSTTTNKIINSPSTSSNPTDEWNEFNVPNLNCEKTKQKNSDLQPKILTNSIDDKFTSINVSWHQLILV